MVLECLTVEITPKDINTSKEVILSPILQLDPKDYFYLFYDPKFKISVVGLSESDVKVKLDELKSNGKIIDYEFKKDENELDISKIVACASRKISDFIEEKNKPLTIDGLINEIVSLPDINALAYEPLHFILNQLRLHEKENEIRFRIFTDPRYFNGYRVFMNNLYR